MPATINSFISAVCDPFSCLQSLTDVKVDRNENDSAAVYSTFDCAEVSIEWQSRRYILSMPLSPLVLQHAQRMSVRLRRLRSAILSEYKILPNEMIYPDVKGEPCFTDLILQEIPNDAQRLDLCIESLSAERLFHAIDLIESEFDRLKLEHTNLDADTVYIDNDYTIYPTALHYTKLAEKGNSNNFKILRRYVGKYFGVDYTDFKQLEAPTKSFAAMHGYKYVGHPFEGLSVIEDYQGRFGYLDIDGVEIVTPQYIWAGDIREGRAEVESSRGMGLIDAKGRYIIEDRYQIVEFNPDTGHSLVKQNEKWALYDYEGRKIKDVENFSLTENCITT